MRNKIAVITSTYWKLDGSTRDHLEDTLLSLKNQTCQDWKLFLIGDDYEKEDEFFELSKIIDQDKMHVENLPVAVEREQYDGRDLWACGGGNATKHARSLAFAEGFTLIAHLNHDDVYLPNHIETTLQSFEDTGTGFVTTKCNKKPEVEATGYYTPYRPTPNNQFLTSVAYDHSIHPFEPRPIEERIAIYGHIYAGDADIWNQINEDMKEKDTWGIFVNELTCSKLGGMDPILRPEIVKRIKENG